MDINVSISVTFCEVGRCFPNGRDPCRGKLIAVPVYSPSEDEVVGRYVVCQGHAGNLHNGSKMMMTVMPKARR